MTNIKNHKILIALLSVVVIVAAVVLTTNFSRAMTADEARKIATSYVPATAEFVETEDHDSNFEVNFYDKTNRESFEVEVHKESKAIKKIESQLDDDRGSQVVKLTEAQVIEIIKSKFPNVTSTKVTLNKDDGLYKYEVSYKAKDFYGSCEVNPETGLILESQLKYGSAITVPNDGSKGEGGLLTKDQAKAAAIKFLGSGKVLSVDLDKEKDHYFYEVEIVKGDIEYELIVDAKSGEVSVYDKDKLDRQDIDEEGDNGDSSSQDHSGLIGQDKAKSIVLNKIGGGSVAKIKLESEDGIKVYEGKAVFGKYEYEFEINAKSGVIIDWNKELQDQYEQHDKNDSDDDDEEDDD